MSELELLEKILSYIKYIWFVVSVLIGIQFGKLIAIYFIKRQEKRGDE